MVLDLDSLRIEREIDDESLRGCNTRRLGRGQHIVGFLASS